MLSRTSEPPPSGAISRQSSRKPTEKPLTAPVIEPPSSPRQTTRAGSTSGLTWKSATWEKKESCRSTPSRPIRTQAGEDLRGQDHPREPPVRTWTQVEVAQVGEGPQVDLLLGLLFDDRGFGDFADRDVGREARVRFLPRASPR